MPVSILVLALVLLVTGLGTTLLGLSLTPTDMGRAWLDVGFTTLTGGVMTLAIGFATRTLAAALERGAPVRQEATDVAVPAAPLAEPVPEAPAPVIAAPAPEASPNLGAAGLAVGGAALATGAALGATLLTDHGTEPKSPPSVEELERDLFAQITAEQPPAAFDIEAEPAASEAPDEAAIGGLTRQSQLQREPAYELRLNLEPDPAAPSAEQTAAAEVPQATVATSPTSGLILDEDLAALVAEEAPLAPFETLEVVGAYDSAGVRFTMYSDGSVNAVAPHGERRYRSLEALRQQLDSGQPAV
ncbi:MAG: hypothetical protein LCH39_06985 [Proteobacteria bacterium]|nr:hypothetical protein [Pseudomonadota bacterium]